MSKTLQKIQSFLSLRKPSNQDDGSINYKELIYKPTTIFGYASNNGVMGSVLGLVLTGVLFVIQRFVSVGIVYDSMGCFIP